MTQFQIGVWYFNQFMKNLQNIKNKRPELAGLLLIEIGGRISPSGIMKNRLSLTKREKYDGKESKMG